MAHKKLLGSLFAFPSLMACLGQKLSMFMLSHFFPALFYNTTQGFTSFNKIKLNDKMIL